MNGEAITAMWNNIRSMFTGKSSREVAKGRLQLVLAHDRTGLEGGRLQEMREEIAKVIARYVQIDADDVEIDIETRSRETQLTVSSRIQTRPAT